jgi:hypothetical protein
MEQNFLDMNDAELLNAKRDLKHQSDMLKKRMEELNQTLQSRFFNIARDELHRQEKDFGCVTIFTDSEEKLKVNIRKKVTSPQDILSNALNNMPIEDAKHYGKITYSIEERKYTNAPPAIRNVLEPARTVDMGSVSFDIAEEE